MQGGRSRWDRLAFEDQDFGLLSPLLWRVRDLSGKLVQPGSLIPLTRLVTATLVASVLAQMPIGEAHLQSETRGILKGSSLMKSKHCGEVVP